MPKIIWLEEEAVLAVHEDQLAEHGGGVGIRDQGLLQSALFRPRNREAYGQPDMAELAAAYAYGIINNHPFLDGNKRTGYIAMKLFLNLNGWQLDADMIARYTIVIQVAEGTISEADFAAWIRAHIKPLKASAD